nr:tyrosinase [Quercus suber]
MKFSLTSLLAATTLLTTPVFSHSDPFDGISFAPEAHEQLEKRASTIAIQGANGIGDNQLHTRLEINTLATRPNQWALFILTMQKFHAASQSNTTGYYQIAGIHGVPRQSWDGVGQCSTCGDADGYCTHDSVLFPAWHRVYLALFEQEFLKIAWDVANSYPAGSQRNTMITAQSTLRFPYWDWAAKPANGGPTVPTTITNQQVTVNGPTGSVTIPNPLYRHYFPDPSNLYYGIFNAWHYTLRWPNSNDPGASSQEQSMINAFNNVRSSLQDQVYQLMSTCSDYLHFSNDDAGSSSTSCSNSLEGIHNTIHNTAGGPGSSTVTSGHMTFLSLASFDPIFWLHHMNVDRLFAMWQTINPNSYGASQVAPHNTWTIKSGSTQNADSPLTPFHKDTVGTFWTTNMVRNWASTFKYTYPEFTDSNGSKSAIVSYVAKLYGPSATATAGSSKRAAAPEPGLVGDIVSDVVGGVEDTVSNAVNAVETVAAVVASIATGTGHFPTIPTSAAPYANLTGHPFKTSNGSTYEYVANIKTPRYALNGSYNVYIFNGAPASEDCSSWLSDKNLVGPMGILAGGDMMNPNLLAAGSVPLTRTLQDMVTYSNLTDMSADHCIPYLTQHLTWRIAKDGKAVDAGSIPGFEVSVYSSTSTPLTEDSLPQWSLFVPHVQVTKQKPGGAKVPVWDTPSGSASSSTAPAPTSYVAKPTVTVTIKQTTTVCECAKTSATIGY